MTIKAFGFLNPTSPENTEKNWRNLDANTKFGNWTPLVEGITNFGSAEGWFQLYGPIVFYWIKLTSDGTDMTPGAPCRIYNLPYGPESESGKKTTSPYQVSMTARGGTGGASELLNNTGLDAWVTSVSGTAYIYLPTTWTAATTASVWVQGWIFRDA